MSDSLFPLASATKVVQVKDFSSSILNRAAALVSGTETARVVVVKDPRPDTLIDGAVAGLLEGRESLLLDRIVPNPQSSDIMAMVDAARAFHPDLVIGIGGGSSLDSAKAVRAMICHQGDLDEYLGPQATRRLEKQGAKLILIPTTTGTGAEVTKFGVYSSRSGRKYSLASPLLQADAAILSAALVAELPPALLASTAYDALTHAMEALWNKNATPVSDLVASDAMVDVLTHFRPAYDGRKEGDSSAMLPLLMAACSAGAAFNMTGTAAIHALSFILSEEWHLSHGSACAFFAEDVFDYNIRSSQVAEKLASVSRRVFPEMGGGDDGALGRLRKELVDLKRHTGLPSTFSAIGVTPDALSDGRIAELFDKAQDDFKMKNNLPPLDAMQVRSLVGAKRG